MRPRQSLHRLERQTVFYVAHGTDSGAFDSAIGSLQPRPQGIGEVREFFPCPLLGSLSGIAILKLIELQTGVPVFTVVHVEDGATALKAVQD
jgi:hypothetical protein